MNRNSINAIIFDLDGTLIDSSTDIIQSLYAAFTLSGVRNVPLITAEHIGPTLPELLQVLKPGLNPGTKEKIILHYRSVYDSIQTPKSTLNPNVLEVLDFLKARSVKLFIATNKPKSATLPLLAYFHIKDYFCDVLTPTSFPGTEMTKGQMINHILTSNCLDFRRTLVIGDHVNDIEAGKINKLKTAAFLGGYTNADTLKKSNPDFLIPVLMDLIKPPPSKKVDLHPRPKGSFSHMPALT